ncbi:MAG: OmcA/MtrC family decaheme c-type cytochrome, partial [Acidobacteria bacterium]|nr:OmcA/MtrC family decaheme c-type cytochrome [Acidobacteriota bacterium]
MRMQKSSGGWMKWTLVVLVLVASTALVSSTKSPFTPQDKAFYADEATVNFVRPGLVFKILGQSIAADGTVKVKFSITDPKGLPLDRLGVTTPGAVSTSFIIATIPADTPYYQAYTTRVKTSTYPPTAGKTARQASGDTGGTYAQTAEGEYEYTFGTKLPTTFDKGATHTIALYGNRNLTEFDLGTSYATTLSTFVPSGAPVTKVRDLFEVESCNKCHYKLSFHGGSRVGFDICVLCHTPKYSIGNVGVNNTNPETDNTIDMKVMAHKIHMGSNLPSVQGGKPYQIVGFGNAVSDWSYVNMPSGPNNCQWCHEKNNDKATQKTAWLTMPGREACGACHDNINFATGEGHLGLPQLNDNQCKNCHIPEGEIDFDASIKGAHVVEQYSSMIQGAQVKILNLENTKPGQKVTVTFSLADRSGKPLDINSLIPGAGRGRLGFTIAALDTDYGKGISATGTSGYVQDSPTTTSGITGTPAAYKYTVATALPADAKGTWTFQIEGRSDEKLLGGTQKERIVEVNIPNQIKYFAVDGTTPKPRRMVTSLAMCNQCHFSLALHGFNRDNPESCIICHNPMMTDAARRPAANMPAESISLASMVHRIHTGEEQPRKYTLWGRGGEIDFSKAKLPPPVTGMDCQMCHTTNGQNVPAGGVYPVVDPRGYLNPAATNSAACIGCHASKDASSHMLANTTSLGESCGTCHGPNGDFAVSKVH